jgi:hypothetical protein
MTGGTPGGEQDKDIRTVSLKEEANKRFSGDIKPETYLQRAGVDIFKWVLWFTVFITVALFSYVLVEMPAVPGQSGSGAAPDTAYVRVILEQRAQIFNNFFEGVSRLLLNLCLPLLTAILGYLFGQRKG